MHAISGTMQTRDYRSLRRIFDTTLELDEEADFCTLSCMDLSILARTLTASLNPRLWLAAASHVAAHHHSKHRN